MKKSIYLACVLLVAGSVYLAVHTSKQHPIQAAKVQATAVVAKTKQEVSSRQKLQSQLNVAEGQVDTLETQCQFGVKNYQLMTPTQRLQATLPVCALQNASASIQ